jgi:hypothetical protein
MIGPDLSNPERKLPSYASIPSIQTSTRASLMKNPGFGNRMISVCSAIAGGAYSTRSEPRIVGAGVSTCAPFILI